MLYKAVLVDLSGTIHIGKEAIPGAIQACRRLLSSGLKVLFLTNTSKISSTALLNQLRCMGFDESVIPESIDGRPTIMTSVGATREYIIQNGLRPYCLVEDDLIEQDFHGISMEDPNCVLVGLAPSKFTYEKINEAYRLLMKLRSSPQSSSESLHLIAIHRAMHYKDSDHELSLGPGGFISILEQTSGCNAHVVGKPSREFFQAALSSLEITNPKDAVMVGDDVIGDVKGALDAGLGGSILVKTGKYVIGDENGEKTEGVQPTITLDSIVEALDYLLNAE
jgi:HAD superfamily hydrolase (TIGR01458 family)